MSNRDDGGAVRQGPPAIPQPVLSPLTGAAIFLVLNVNPGGENAVRALLPEVAGLQRAVGFRLPDGSLTCVAGIGSAAWDRLFAGPRPAGLHTFREIGAGPRRAIATPGDLLFHIRSSRMDACFELATQIMNQVGAAVAVADEVHGFRYFDERDLLGFVDGTENPSGPAAEAAVTVGEQDPPFAGGSYVAVQKYLHDMAAWNALRTEEQERVIGRSKLANIELADDVKPANSHVALTTITGPAGGKREILRDNMPFGNVGAGEFGTYFIGYAATPDVIEQMLENMFVGDPPGNYDRILDFSVPVTGGLFYVPTADFLEDPPAPPGERRVPAAASAEPTAASPEPTAASPEPAAASPEPAAASPEPAAAGAGSAEGDGSLGIGGLGRRAADLAGRGGGCHSPESPGAKGASR